MDMWSAYIWAVRGNLPRAYIVFDRFHVVKLTNEKLTTLRRQVHPDTNSRHPENTDHGQYFLYKRCSLGGVPSRSG